MDKIDMGKVPSPYVVIKLKDKARRNQALILFDKVFGYQPHAVIIKKIAGVNNEFMVIASPKVSDIPPDADKVKSIVDQAVETGEIMTGRGGEIIPPVES